MLGLLEFGVTASTQFEPFLEKALTFKRFLMRFGTPSHRPAGLKVTVESNTGRHHVPKYEAGDYNQGEFPDEATGVAEWMWVRVHSCDDTNKVVISP